jgi:hypothetical protein
MIGIIPESRSPSARNRDRLAPEYAEVDFKSRVVGRGGVFTLLEAVDYFGQVKIDPEAGTIMWPNEVDFCPDILYYLATGRPILSLELV